jgi:hypothetical protein
LRIRLAKVLSGFTVGSPAILQKSPRLQIRFDGIAIRAAFRRAF